METHMHTVIPPVKVREIMKVILLKNRSRSLVATDSKG